MWPLPPKRPEQHNPCQDCRYSVGRVCYADFMPDVRSHNGYRVCHDRQPLHSLSLRLALKQADETARTAWDGWVAS